MDCVSAMHESEAVKPTVNIVEVDHRKTVKFTLDFLNSTSCCPKLAVGIDKNCVNNFFTNASM
jgi:hypothetical protein